MLSLGKTDGASELPLGESEGELLELLGAMLSLGKADGTSELPLGESEGELLELLGEMLEEGFCDGVSDAVTVGTKLSDGGPLLLGAIDGCPDADGTNEESMLVGTRLSDGEKLLLGTDVG